MEVFSENKFINDFLTKYKNSGEYDFTIIFDDFYENFINNNSHEFINKVFQYYFKNNEPFNIHNLYDKLYFLIENIIIDNYESDADTDND